jgi:hypothetical protein
VSGFSINPTTGALTEIPGSPFAINGRPPQALFVVPAGQFLFVAGSSGGTAPEYSLTGYQISPASGALSPIPGMPITSTTSFERAVFHPNGRALYLPAGSDGVRAYSIHPTTGVMTAVPGEPYRLPDDWSSRTGAFNPSGTTLLVASEPTSNQGQPPRSRVSAFAADVATGALTLRGTVDYARAAGNMVLHPDGKRAYSWTAGQAAVVGLIGIENPASLTIAEAAFPGVGASFNLSFGAILDEGGQHLYLGYGLQSLNGGRPA